VSENLFESIADPRLRRLAQRGTVRQYRKGSTLIEEGDLGSTIYIVLKGRLKAFSRAIEGSGREITFGVCGVGDFVGEMSLDEGPRSASVSALETSTCAQVTKDTVKRFIADEPEFAFELLERVIARARNATHSARSMVLTNAYGRLTELFTALAVKQADGTLLVPERLAQHEIASRIGCTREMVSRLLKDLESGGYLELTEGKFFLIRKNLPIRW
jgi:CRP/FNR family transcriptional regulator, cyclic AMP receptor protein